jgi:branched-chain amino acid transport system substrate-binding protein
MFRYTMHDDAQAPALVDYAYDKLGFRKIGILIENTGWGEGGRVDAVGRLKELKLEPVAIEKFNLGDKDMTPQLLRLKNAGAECAIYYGQITEGVQIMRARARLSFPLPIISAWGIAGKAFWDNAGDLAEGVNVLVTATPDAPLTPKRKAFIEKYEAKYGEGSIMEHFGGIMQSYDIMNLIAIAIEKAGEADPKKVREALENIPSFDGVLMKFDRPVWTKDEHDALRKEDFIMCVWTKGKLLPVEK